MEPRVVVLHCRFQNRLEFLFVDTASIWTYSEKGERVYLNDFSENELLYMTKRNPTMYYKVHERQHRQHFDLHLEQGQTVRRERAMKLRRYIGVIFPDFCRKYRMFL